MNKTRTMFGANIKLLRKRRSRSQEEVAVGMEIKRSSLSGYENGAAEPNFDTLIRFSGYFNISIDKLLKFKLLDLSESQLSELERGYDIDITGNRLRVLTSTVDSDDVENIELVPIAAKAGYTAGYADPDFIKVLPTFQLPFLSRQKKYRTFPVSGDSMPPVADGSYVTGEYVQNWNLIKSGYPYIILTKDDGIVFKIIYNHINERKSLQLCSTNPLYEPYEISVKEVVEVWKFVNYISAELPEPNLSKDQLTDTVLNLQREVSRIKNVLRNPEA
jgi:transcriptional regulator with XRE-family HTH domain